MTLPNYPSTIPIQAYAIEIRIQQELAYQVIQTIIISYDMVLSLPQH